MLEQIPSYNAAMNNINKHNFVVGQWDNYVIQWAKVVS